MVFHVSSLFLSFCSQRGRLWGRRSGKERNKRGDQSVLCEREKNCTDVRGLSGAGYQNEASMLRQAERILGEFEANKTIVNIGGTSEGIGAIYEVARRNGFVTAGIVSTQAQ